MLFLLVLTIVAPPTPSLAQRPEQLAPDPRNQGPKSSWILMTLGCPGGCGVGKYCSFDQGTLDDSMCTDCPHGGIEDCSSSIGVVAAVEDCLRKCDYSREVNEECGKRPGRRECLPGSMYCDEFFDDDSDDESLLLDQEEELKGSCQPCVENLTECLSLSPDEGIVEQCLEQCDLACESFLSVQINNNTQIMNKLLHWSPVHAASGPIVHCVPGETTQCPLAATDAICLFELQNYGAAFNLDRYVETCQSAGGKAVIFYEAGFNETDVRVRFVSQHAWNIPATRIDANTVVNVQDGDFANLTVLGQVCKREQACSDLIPCLGRHANSYCYAGRCYGCPVHAQTGAPEPFGCFFDSEDWILLDQIKVINCATQCGARLDFGDCKFCPSTVTGVEFGVEDPADKCHFCPLQDVQFPDKVVRIFGEATTCWQIQSFFETVDLHVESQNCKLAQMFNYICGCTGPGYGGASTPIKRSVLAWLPRTMAICSFFGSLFIIWDATRSRSRRSRMIHQLMVSLSGFDMVGAVAYALTSLPIPATDYIYGSSSSANAATCIAQGFFIQIGTISCYTNVSLAVYYYLVIKLGWSEHRVKKQRRVLFASPVVVGLIFAFAGIPHYDNMILWCNNAAPWWPDIPVAVAIAIATVLMGIVCWDVYQKEKGSAKWRAAPGSAPETAQNKLSTQVFWQAFWYLMAFYLTWPPYLALQYSWASGHALTNYGLILAAGTMAPLQGFWNFIIYIRPRYLLKKQSGNSNRSQRPTTSTTSHRSLYRLSTKMLSKLKSSMKLQLEKESETVNVSTAEEESFRGRSGNLTSVNSAAKCFSGDAAAANQLPNLLGDDPKSTASTSNADEETHYYSLQPASGGGDAELSAAADNNNNAAVSLQDAEMNLRKENGQRSDDQSSSSSSRKDESSTTHPPVTTTPTLTEPFRIMFPTE